MKPVRADAKEIERALAVLFRRDDVVELRIPKTERDGTVSGYFQDHAALAKKLASRNGDVAVYMTLNPVVPALLARCANHVRRRARTTTSDHDVQRRRWMLLDCDPVRPAEISSSDLEHDAALERARAIRFELGEAGWPAPVLADSGNGAHLLYLIDLENDEAAATLIATALRALAARFNDAAVQVDVTVYNAGRIVKAYGTVARKGDDTPDRPHRLSRFLDVPNKIEPVPRELLKELAATLKEPDPPRSGFSAGRSQFDFVGFVAHHLDARPPVPYQGGRKYPLKACPFNPEHTDAAVFERADGSLEFHCFHSSCSDKHWRDVREMFEGPRPSAEQPPAADSPEPAESPFPAFPEIAWRGLFREYRDAMNGTTEACDAAHFATFWAAVAVILGRKVEMHAGDVVYPNVYLDVYGPTGDKKTTAERRILSCNLFEYWPHIRLVRGVGSTEGLADAVKDSETGDCLYMWEEFSAFLSQARWTGSTLLEFFVETFDCPPEWNKPYRNKPIHLETPTPSILTGCTPEWFWRHARTEDFFGGIFNRFLFFTGARKALLPNPNIVDGEAIARIKDHLKIVAARAPCRANWTTDAKKTFDAFYVKFESAERSSLLRAATKRVHVYVRKLVMTYAALEQTLPHIDKEQLEAAIAVVMHSVACTERLLDLQAVSSKPQAELEERFLRYIAKHEGERVRRLQQKMARYCGDAETFNRVLKSLLHADRIEIQDRRVCLST